MLIDLGTQRAERIMLKIAEKNENHHIALDLLAIALVILMLYLLKPIVVPILFAIILSVVIFPFVGFLEYKVKLGSMLSALLGVIIMYSLIMCIVYFVLVQISYFAEDGDKYIDKINEMYQNLRHYLMQKSDIGAALPRKNIEISEMAEENSDIISGFLNQLTTFIGDAVLVPVYMFFIIYFRHFFCEFVYRVFKMHNAELDDVLYKIYCVIQNYLLGMVTVMGIVGLLNSAGLLLLGIDNAVFFGFLGSFLLIIPYIGITIGAALPTMVALVTKDSYWYAIGVVGVFVFVQILEGNIITPSITGSKVSLNAFVSIVALIAFALLWGMAGMILALPMTAIIKIIFDHNPYTEAYGFLLGEPDKKLLGESLFKRNKKAINTDPEI